MQLHTKMRLCHTQKPIHTERMYTSLNAGVCVCAWCVGVPTCMVLDDNTGGSMEISMNIDIPLYGM